MTQPWPALRGVLWEYCAALLLGGFWGHCSHGMPHVIRIGKRSAARGGAVCCPARGRDARSGAGTGASLHGAGRETGAGAQGGAGLCRGRGRWARRWRGRGMLRMIRGASRCPVREGMLRPGEGDALLWRAGCCAPEIKGCCAFKGGDAVPQRRVCRAPERGNALLLKKEMLCS